MLLLLAIITQKKIVWIFAVLVNGLLGVLVLFRLGLEPAQKLEAGRDLPAIRVLGLEVAQTPDGRQRPLRRRRGEAPRFSP